MLPPTSPVFIPCSPHGVCGAWQRELWRFSYDESDGVSRPEAEEPLVTAEGLGLSPLEGPEDFWWTQSGPLLKAPLWLQRWFSLTETESKGNDEQTARLLPEMW